MCLLNEIFYVPMAEISVISLHTSLVAKNARAVSTEAVVNSRGTHYHDRAMIEVDSVKVQIAVATITSTIHSGKLS